MESRDLTPEEINKLHGLFTQEPSQGHYFEVACLKVDDGRIKSKREILFKSKDYATARDFFDKHTQPEGFELWMTLRVEGKMVAWHRLCKKEAY